MSHRIGGCFASAVLLALAAVAPAQTRPPAIELVEPAPGCPVKVPTLESLSAYCGTFSQPDCSHEARCTWAAADRDADGKDRPAHCGAKAGAYMSPRAMSPTDDQGSIDFDEAVEAFTEGVRGPSDELADRAHDAAADRR